MNKEQLFESILNEAQIEVFPQNGKLQARGVGEKVVSNKTHNKLSGLDTQETTMPLTKTQLDGTKAVIAYLKSKNKLNDISAQFDTDPRPDIAFNGAGDAIITPDGGKGHPYQIPAEELEPFYEGNHEAIETEERIQENSSNGFLACCYDPEDYYQETNYVDRDGELHCNSSGCEVFATEEEAEEWADDNRPYGWVSFAMPAGCGPSLKEHKESFFNKLLEAIEDFPKSTHSMYRFARRRHNDTGAVRKVSGQPYWVHPEGVALIVMKHGGSDIEIKAAMAHDVLEDTGDTFEDMVEKFGYEVASIVNEITNDKDEIKRVDKEQYISDELCRISDEALTVKLADMLYNQKDSPTESNYIRMRNNVNYMLNNREDLLPIHKELAQEILDV